MSVFETPLTDPYIQVLYAPIYPASLPSRHSGLPLTLKTTIMSDVLTSASPPISRFLLISAPVVAGARKGLEILLWRDPERGWSWGVILAWWVVCLGGTEILKYFLPPLVLLGYLYPSLPRLYDVLLFRFNKSSSLRYLTPRPASLLSKPATSQTILQAVSNYSAVHALLAQTWPPRWLSHSKEEWENGHWKRVLRRLIGIWAVWVLAGLILGPRVTLGTVGAVILFLPSPYVHPIQTAFQSSYHLNRLFLFLSLLVLGPSASTPPSSETQLFAWAWSASATQALLGSDSGRGRTLGVKSLLMGLRRSTRTTGNTDGKNGGTVESTKEEEEEKEWEEEPVVFRFEVIENQRWWLALDWTATLAPGDRPVWCDTYLNPTPAPPSFTLPLAHTVTVPSTTRPNYDEVRTASWRWAEDEWSVLRNIEGQFKSSFVPPKLSESPTNAHHPLPATSGQPSRNPGSSNGVSSGNSSGSITISNRMSLGEQALSRGLERLKAATTSAGPSAAHPPNGSSGSTSTGIVGSLSFSNLTGVTHPGGTSQSPTSQPKRSSSISSALSIPSSSSVDGERKTLFAMSLQGGGEVLAGEAKNVVGGHGGALGLGMVECEDLEARTDEIGWSYGGNKWEGMTAKGGLGKFTRRRRWTRKAICTEHVVLVPSSYKIPEAPARPSISSVDTTVPSAAPILVSHDPFLTSAVTTSSVSIHSATAAGTMTTTEAGNKEAMATTTAVKEPVGVAVPRPRAGSETGGGGIKGEVTNAGASAGDALKLRLKRLV
ncbi:Peroxin/Ferlin domain [Phaffia rhodozyma]|uniref:Peroxin/Ferlin domain n=1 Tax=Phaffia rhodozyma TaxID=264483 RepID=A0A0F7SXQ3_PHARH|nr:Peroxin/Ferlin domain [Phaffia rhodozyma]